MNAPIPTRPNSFVHLCEKVCDSYGFSGGELERADRKKSYCYRSRGPGRPRNETRYPGLFVTAFLPLLLVASQRRTALTIDQVAKILDLDEWDALSLAVKAEGRLAADPDFALALESLLSDFDGEQRAQSSTYDHAMTYEEVAAEMGISWQRVQQIEKRAFRKLRDSGLLDELLEGIRG